MRLDGKVALVTGGREGLGRSIAVGLAEAGADVAVMSRKMSSDEGVVADIKAAGSRALAVSGDAGCRADVDAVIEAVVSELGRLDIVINNAGFIRPAMLHKMSDEDWDAVIRVHLSGAFYVTRRAAQVMIAAGCGGRIINITSSAGLTGTVGQINYSAAKAGVIGLTKSAARELSRHQITVNAISPLARTRMTEKIATDPKLSEKYLARIPLGRFGTPEEIVPSVVLMASDAGAYITGQVLCVDGGMVM